MTDQEPLRILRAKVHHLRKRLRSIPHRRRGHASIAISGQTVKITAESALMMENTRRNALSERELVADLLKHVDGESLLDVGAGYGTEALLAAKAGAASVCAIDADEERAAYVEKNASLNNIEIDVKAALVGDGDGTFCIDDLGFSPTIAKMDIEGAEWSALNGMGDTLESIDRFYLEVHPTTIPEEASVAGIKSLLVDAGFDVSMRPCRSEQLHLTAVRHVSRCPTP